ncbi:putative Phage-associated protein [Richelia sinica FACHB-800]|uniref:Phage-associated protein n=1 Tax=Richelia sinica FACHB-800 TaxID=1357546 RepID=A0A975TAB4_9NOST|nr:type II toxin-antitoxin system antitoxin SocA domain-containing protein [Richelia sinica]MBD2665612.1 SocA family protein [Richelia sinica FACHB-800]QXE24815.1 putative Phage-associated protein [Richelia sinica FACHB-800]
MKNALDVARYFLHRVDREVGETISPLKLQKLVYYAQAWHLVFYGRLLFPDNIQAWIHGPVVYSVWNENREYEYKAIPKPDEPVSDFTNDELVILEEVWSVYGELGAKQLERLTHAEYPWIHARGDLAPTEKSSEIISTEDMMLYYVNFADKTDSFKIHPSALEIHKGHIVNEPISVFPSVELIELVQQLQYPLRTSPELYGLAQAAIDSLSNRKLESMEIEEWACKLANDVKNAID